MIRGGVEGDVPLREACRMRPRIDGPMARTSTPSLPPQGLRDAEALADLFVGIFRRDLLNFFPQAGFEPVAGAARPDGQGGPDFRLVEGPADAAVAMFGAVYRIGPRAGGAFTAQD